jgi:DNA polymerase I-like protein with 3'-5' exonuclease and polymerase domains
MDTWLGEMFIDELGRPYYLVDDKKVRRISMVHDEYSWECEDGIQDYVKQLSVKAIVKAGEILKLALPLAAEGKIGNNWKDVH